MFKVKILDHQNTKTFTFRCIDVFQMFIKVRRFAATEYYSLTIFWLFQIMQEDDFRLSSMLKKSIRIIGSGGIEKSHSCKWAKWIQWHALPHIQQSTQQWNKGHNPNLHGWDFSIPPSPNHRTAQYNHNPCNVLVLYVLFTDCIRH